MRWFVGAALAAGLAGCGSEQSEQDRLRSEDYELEIDARMAVSDRLRDPNSARFEGVFVSRSSGLPVVCGQVNAKNAFGGYAGAKPFYFAGRVAVIADAGNVEEFRTAWTDLCQR